MLLFLTTPLFAQTDVSSIGGTIIESWEGKPLSGVTVTLRGTTLATTTDALGRFELSPVPAGEHVLRFSKSGYSATLVTEVRVLPGQRSTVNGVLRPEFFEMDEYEVTAEEFQEQAVQLMQDRQQASAMMDAVGSDMFKNLAVSDAAQALSKVTGATVADGKYAVVRGLADRYTFTTMNGMELPSADPDRKAFQLDLFPAKFIEKVDVRKTFTPDMSGGFAGGLIDIVSKSYPDKFLFEFRAETAYNTQSNLRDDFAGSNQSSTDWMGFDDGERELPKEAESANPSGNQLLPDAVKRSFKSTQFAPVPIDSPLDSGLSLQLGDTRKVFGKKLGFLGGFNYKNEYRYYDQGLVRSYQNGTTTSIDKTDERGVIDYQWGGLLNLSLALSDDHELKFNFLYIQSAQDEARRLQGQDGDVTSLEDGTHVEQLVLKWTERNLTYYQLAGVHKLPELQDIRFDWGAAISTTTQDEPDFRIFQLFADPGNSFYNPETTAAKPSRPTRYWRELQEDNLNVRGDLTIPMPSYNSKDNLLKAGAALSSSKRDYNQRGFEYSRNRATGFQHPFFSTGDPNRFVTDENLQYLHLQNFPVNLTYTGEQDIHAAYLMGEWAAFEWLRLVGGARYETTDLSITSENLTNPGISPDPGSIQQEDVLPSLSVVLQLHEKVDLRASWSQTVVRPTYREIAAVELYDVTQNRTYFGNPALVSSSSDNLDLRLSWYPREGEILSAGVFGKKIGAPIELSSVTTDNSQITYVNFDDAEVFGVEAEVRLKLDRLWEPLEQFTVGLNGAYIQSEVALTDVQKGNRSIYGDTASTRPLYSQPSYIINGDLTWENARTGTTISVSGGVVGESLVLVGLAKPDEYVQPAPDLNVFVRQKLGKHWDVRFTAKNLLDPTFDVAQTWPDAGQVVLQSYTKGRTFGLSVGCEF